MASPSSSSSSASASAAAAAEDAPNPELAEAAQSNFVGSSALVKSLLEDATTAALTTALASLPYAPSDAKRWIATMSGLGAPPLPPPPCKHIFNLFLGSYHPALDGLSASELAGCWHIAHYLATPECNRVAIEETLIQRFAAGELGPIAGTGAAGGGEGGGAAAASSGTKRK